MNAYSKKADKVVCCLGEKVSGVRKRRRRANNIYMHASLFVFVSAVTNVFSRFPSVTLHALC